MRLTVYDLPGSRFEVPLQLGVDGSRADGLMKHRIEGSSTPEIAKPARPFTYSSAEVLEVVFAGTPDSVGTRGRAMKRIWL